jgi:hypothetical protein
VREQPEGDGQSSAAEGAKGLTFVEQVRHNLVAVRWDQQP